MLALLLVTALIVCLLILLASFPTPESNLLDYPEPAVLEMGHTTIILRIGFNQVMGYSRRMRNFLRAFVHVLWSLITRVARPVQHRAALCTQLLKQVRMNTLFGRGILHA